MNYPIKHQNQSDLEWAKDKLDDVLLGSILNIKLYHAGICPTLIIDMSAKDLFEYTKFLETILIK